MNQFLEKNRRLLRLYCVAASIIGWVLLWGGGERRTTNDDIRNTLYAIPYPLSPIPYTLYPILCFLLLFWF